MAQFLKEQGIEHLTTNVASPEMNGVAERYNRTIVEATKTCLIDARLPNEFWGEVMTALSY